MLVKYDFSYLFETGICFAVAALKTKKKKTGRTVQKFNRVLSTSVSYAFIIIFRSPVRIPIEFEYETFSVCRAITKA